MPVYEYRAYDAAGKTRRGVIDADGSRSARGKLRSQGLLLTELVEAAAKGMGAQGQGLFARLQAVSLFQRVSQAELSAAMRQLATLLSAGLPLVAAITALMEQTENLGLKRVLADVKDRVSEGVSLADSLSRHPKVFPELFSSMVAAGEASGALEIVLERLVEFMEGRVRLNNKVRSTLAYPILMLVVGSGVLLFLLTYVVPMVTGIFEDTGQVLPMPTIILMAVSRVMSRFWWLLLVLVAAAFFGLRRYIQTEAGRVVYDRFRIRAPLIGNLTRKLVVARFARTLGTLLKAGIPMLRALDISKTVVGNKIFVSAIEAARDNVGEGEDLATPFRRSGVFPPLVIHMVSAGEQSGELENMLLRVADSYENDVEATVASLTSLLEPVMIMTMGLVVGFIVLAILLPIFEMSNIVR
jgi:general secretion pathway protein F